MLGKFLSCGPEPVQFVRVWGALLLLNGKPRPPVACQHVDDGGNPGGCFTSGVEVADSKPRVAEPLHDLHKHVSDYMHGAYIWQSAYEAVMIEVAVLPLEAA